MTGQEVKDVWEWRIDAKRNGIDTETGEVTWLSGRIVELEETEEAKEEEVLVVKLVKEGAVEKEAVEEGEAVEKEAVEWEEADEGAE